MVLKFFNGLGLTSEVVKENAEMHRQRVEALKRLQRVLELAVRTFQTNPPPFIESMIEQICLLIWDFSLPLLQVENNRT